MNAKIILMGTVLIVLSQTQGLRHGGKHVCSRIEQRTERYIAKVKKSVPVIKKVKCWVITKNFQCDRVVNEERIVDEVRTRVTYVPVNFCCPGFQLDGAECVQRSDFTNHWTASASGCQCYFDPLKDCACCVYGGCQCGSQFPNKCVQCGSGDTCGTIFDEENRKGVDAWTKSETGCACDGTSNPGECPCCQHGGCQCKKGNTRRCRQCGLPYACYNEDNP